MSRGLLASRIIKRAPRACAASCTVALSVAAWATLAGLTSTAIVEAGDVRLYISSKHFLNNSTFKLVTPVILPPGCAVVQRQVVFLRVAIRNAAPTQGRNKCRHQRQRLVVIGDCRGRVPIGAGGRRRGMCGIPRGR